MRSKLLLLMLVIGILSLAVTGIASAELLPNPGFEEGMWEFRWGDRGSGGAQDNWNVASWDVITDPEVARSGNNYLLIGNYATWWASWGWTQVGEELPATGGTEYTLSAYFMDGWGGSGYPGTKSGQLKITFFQEHGNKLQTDTWVDISRDHDLGWQWGSHTFVAPAGTVMLRAILGQGDVDSYMRIDDASLTSDNLKAVVDDPAVGATVGYTCQTNLSWGHGSNAATFDVYLRADTDPGSIVASDLIADDISAQTVPVTLLNNTDYIWRVDSTCIDPNNADPNSGPVETIGDVWSFSTGDAAPEFDAGSDQYLWLDPSSATANLDGVICDDGNSAVTYLWSSPDAEVEIASPTSLVTTATVSATGSYTITLTVTDAWDFSVSDTVLVSISDDACEAAIADPGQTLVGDISDPSGAPDCVVDIFDFAAMAIDWLDCASAKLGCTP